MHAALPLRHFLLALAVVTVWGTNFVVIKLALAHLPPAQRVRTRLIVIGQDAPEGFRRQAAALGLAAQVDILAGRSDIPRFLLGADLLIHPAYNENTGTVLL